MSKPRRTFFYDRPLTEGVYHVEGREARHIAGSLRLGPGDEIALIDGSGRQGIAELQEVNAAAESVRVRIFEVREAPDASGLTLAVSVPKDSRMDWLVEKCAELGVDALVPTVFRRSVVRPKPGRTGKADKWDRIALEASKQSGRPSLLSIPEYRDLEEVAALPAGLKVLLDPAAEEPLGALVAAGRPPSVLAAVGPEGGLEPAEAEALEQAGFRRARLAPYVLRIETAAVAAAAVILAARRDGDGGTGAGGRASCE
ncbi:MAG: 16S rRNA (uracil(1498)-N(3))-methyltransferase [Planctomycetes bacterium]|jgi:16S rRNA (uracil1498-N3)-methyltransferase|nr:16S rRNA (uracil(1498)-N(3))-methyltransferase [Planctomycetota bacterium]